MKRGTSGLSLLVGVNKPSGLTSHDVVNRCRRIFGERRCGHTGTLDPLATGVLPICVGPATRLDHYLTSHDKRYRVTMGFGFETTTDDATGQRTVEGKVPSYLREREFAEQRLAALERVHSQVPPQDSAVKVAGKKAYEVARAGGELKLEARQVEVFSARLVDLLEDIDGLAVQWVVDLHVSKGTYVRSLVRDLGREVLCPAHVVALERRVAGNIAIERCVSLESLENLKEQAALDPVRVLGFRYAFADDVERFVGSGTKLFAHQVQLMDPQPMSVADGACPCTTLVEPSCQPPVDGELASLVVANRLKALYAFDALTDTWKPSCVFSTGIYRG